VSPITRSESRTLSRRHVLKRGAAAAAAGAAAPVFSGWASPLTPAADAATLPLVNPKWSQSAVESFGVCAMPLHEGSVYEYRSAWISNLASMGVSFIRGTYKQGFGPTYETANLLRQHRMKWNMVLVTDLKQSDADITARVKDIAAKYADVCIAVEGINEPNTNRRGPQPANWKELTLQKQKVLWQAVQAQPALRGKVAVLGPSLHMQRATESDFQWFGAHGLNNYMTHAGTHCYPAGRYIDSNFETLTRAMRRYWPKPVWITETGYNNALSLRGGQAAVPEWVAGIYAPSAALEAIDRGWKVNWFEALDDLDTGLKDNVEANYGLYALGSTKAPPWRAKPAAVALKGILNGLKDPGPAYKPRAIGLRVSAATPDVRWTALGKRDGSVRLYLRRTAEVYDTQGDRKLSVAPVKVTITTAKGTRTVSVGPEVVSVLL
jgi:Glycosyl hydrolase catalytic core